MRHDLVNKHLRPGITVSEVEILLGAGEGDSATLTYRLRNRGYIDPEFDRLIVGFDDAGTLSSVRIESAREGD